VVIIYRVSPLLRGGETSHQVDHIGILQHLADERVVRELIQDDAEPAWITAEIAPYSD